MRCVLSSEHPLSPEVTVTDTTPYTIVLTLDHSEVCFEDYTFHSKISWSRADGEWSLPVEVPLIPSYTITGLSPGSEYRVRVLAESEEDSTIVSGPVTVRAVTLAGVFFPVTHACMLHMYHVYMHSLFSFFYYLLFVCVFQVPLLDWHLVLGSYLLSPQSYRLVS